MKALVCGTAASLLDDIAAASRIFKPDVIIAVNDAGLKLPIVDHWASCHIGLFPDWIAQREVAGLPPAGQLWTNDSKIPNLSGEQKKLGLLGAPYDETSSGGLGINVALELGADRIVAVGMPMENGPHFEGDENFTWAEHYQKQWLASVEKWNDRVRSMSGWSMKLLAKPTKKWLNEA